MAGKMYSYVRGTFVPMDAQLCTDVAISSDSTTALATRVGDAGYAVFSTLTNDVESVTFGFYARDTDTFPYCAVLTFTYGTDTAIAEFLAFPDVVDMLDFMKTYGGFVAGTDVAAPTT